MKLLFTISWISLLLVLCVKEKSEQLEVCICFNYWQDGQAKEFTCNAEIMDYYETMNVDLIEVDCMWLDENRAYYQQIYFPN